MHVIGQLQSGDDNGYESSIDNDDDISSDDDAEIKAGSEVSWNFVIAWEHTTATSFKLLICNYKKLQ